MAFRGIQATNLITNEVGFDDPLLILNKNSSLPQDVGFLGKIGPITYAGLVRDHETNQFWLIDSVDLTPQSLNSINAGEVTKGNLAVGTLTADTIIGGGLNNTLSGLSDVNSNDTPSSSDMILYDGSTWNYVNYENEINTRILANNASLTLTGLANVGHSGDTVADGDFLLYDSSTSRFGYVNFQSEVVSYADARIAATNSNHVAFGDSISATAFEGKLYDTNGNVIMDNTSGNVGIGGKTASFDVFDGDLHGEVIHPTTGSKVIDMQYSTPIYTGNVIGILEGVIYNSNGNPVLDNGSISGSPSFGGRVDGDVIVDETFVLPKGTTAQRPASPVEGQMWFNTTTKMFEGYDGTNWVQLIPSTYVETP